MSTLVCNYDSDKNILFVQKHRCGTSLLHDIAHSGKYQALKRYSYEQLFEQHQTHALSPDNLKVVTVFRHPVRNFLSALNMVFDNNTLEFCQHDHFDPNMFHLGDWHPQHDLMQTLVLGAAGYDIEFVKLSDYSEFLLAEYPQCRAIIDHNHRDNSFDPEHTDLKQIEMWLKYEQYINSDQFNCEFYKSWQDWMEPELMMFEYYKKCMDIDVYYDAEDRTDLYLQALDYLLKHPHYWCEVALGNDKLKNQLSMIVLFAETYPGCLPDSLVELAEHRFSIA